MRFMARLSAQAKQRIYSNLEKYARSGMGMEKACQSLLGQPRIRPVERRIYTGLLEGIQQGKSIAQALGDSSPVITPLEEEIISAAETGGMLEKGFGHLSEYFRRLHVTRGRILRGLAYPVILLHIAIPVSTLAVAVFGQFSLDGSAPRISYVEAFREMGMIMVLGYLALALVIAWSVLLVRLGRRSAVFDQFLNRIPLVGRARRSAAMERFSQVFEIFLLAGKKISESLEGAGHASASGLIREASRRGADLTAEGDSLASAICAFPDAFPDDFSRGIAAAEESGQLDRELAEWSRFYSEEAREAMERVAEWTPRLFYWAVLLSVACLIIRSAVAYRDLLMNLIEGF